MSVPDLVGLCVPGDLYRLPDGEFANLRFVEVGVDLNFVQISDIDQVLAGGHEIIGGDGDGVDCAGFRCPDIEGSIAALRGCECCAGICDLRFDSGLICGAVALGGARLNGSARSFRLFASVLPRRRPRWRRRRLFVRVV